MATESKLRSELVKNLIRAQYIGKDFDTYVLELTNFLKQRFGPSVFNNFNESELGIMFLELVAFAHDTLSFYLDKQASESFLDTANLRNSVVRLTRLIGFKMTGAISASTTLNISQQTPKSFIVSIPAGTQLTSTGGLIFETDKTITFKKIEPITGTWTFTSASTTITGTGAATGTDSNGKLTLNGIQLFGPNGENRTVIKRTSGIDTEFIRIVAAVSSVPGSATLTLESAYPTITPSPHATTAQIGDIGPIAVGVKEGETVEQIFLGTGKPNQTFKLTTTPEGKAPGDKSVQVFVNTQAFTESVFLLFEKSNVFEAQLASVPALIRFGDGVSGNIPAENSEILVRYLATSGLNGNITANSITEFRFPIVVNFQSVGDLSISQSNATTGGAAFFDLGKAKAEAPLVFKSQDRAVTEEDYSALAETFTDPDFGAVFKAKAIYTIPANCHANEVEVFLLTIDQFNRYRAPSVNLISATETFLNTKKEATVQVFVKDGTGGIILVDLSIKVRIRKGASQTAVTAAVDSAVREFLLVLKFGESLRLSDLFDIVESQTDVLFSQISITNPVTPPAPATFSSGDLVVGAKQIVEAQNIVISFL